MTLTKEEGKRKERGMKEGGGEGNKLKRANVRHDFYVKMLVIKHGRRAAATSTRSNHSRKWENGGEDKGRGQGENWEKGIQCVEQCTNHNCCIALHMSFSLVFAVEKEKG